MSNELRVMGNIVTRAIGRLSLNVKLKIENVKLDNIVMRRMTGFGFSSHQSQVTGHE